MIHIYWEKKIFKWFRIAELNNDKVMINFLKKVILIDKSIVDYLIKNYIVKCKQKHSLAFFQWRLYFNKNKLKNKIINTNNLLK